MKSPWRSIATALCVLSAADALADEPVQAPPAFAIHLVVDEVTVEEAREMALDALPLESEPLLTERDLEAYRWPAHVLQVPTEVAERLNEIAAAGMRSARHGDAGGAPELFVVSAGGERVYLGAFWALYRSSIPAIPHIPIPTSFGDHRPPAIRIEMLRIEELEDPRGDPRIRDALERAGVLRENP